jgi:hypothetical protein
MSDSNASGCIVATLLLFGLLGICLLVTIALALRQGFS